MISRSFVFAVGCALLLANATACKRKDPDPAPPPALPKPSEPWLRGELPASVDDGTPVKGGTLTVRVPAEPAMLNRLHDRGSDGWAVRMVVGNVVETLLELDRDTAPNYQLGPKLAERWELAEDGRTVIFHLRKGVRFHDGSTFDSADVRAVLETLLDEKYATTILRSFLSELQSFETPDAHTVVMRWKSPANLSIRDFAVGVPMLPKEALEGSFDALTVNRSPIGTGPFRFENWDTGRAITLVRNDTYWGRAAWLDRVVFRIVRDHTVATQLLEQGEFDVMTAVQPTVWRELEKPDPRHAWAVRGYHRVRFTENGYEWIGWNQERPYFKDVKVRRALGHLIPYAAVEQGIYLGLQSRTTCPFYVEGPYCDPEVQPLRHDPEAAKRLLREAGYVDSDGDGVVEKDGIPLRFTFSVFAHSVSLGKLAPLLQEEFRKAGVQLEIERLEWAVFIQRLRAHQFDMASLAWSTQDVEQDLFQAFHSSQRDGGSNYVSYVNSELDGLLEQARRTFEPSARTALLRRIHRTLYDDQVYAFLGARTSLDLVKTRVRGLKPALNWYDLSRVWLSPEKL